MLVNLLGGLYGPDVIAAFSGALLFTLVQHTFRGLRRLLIFLVSFLMGIVGANATLSLVSPWLPADATFGKETGAFICSALIVNVAMLAINRVEKLIATGH